MQPALLLSILSLVQSRAFTSAHNLDYEFPIPGIFGRPSTKRWLPRHMTAQVQSSSAPDLGKRDANKKCGPGFGFCDSGQWYVHLMRLSQS